MSKVGIQLPATKQGKPTRSAFGKKYTGKGWPGRLEFPNAQPLDRALFGNLARLGPSSLAQRIYVDVDKPIGCGHHSIIFPAFIPGEVNISRSVVKARRHNGTADSEREITNEVLLLRKMEHPNIVMFYGAMQYQGGAALLLERLRNWTLTIIKENSPDRKIPEQVMRPIIQQVLLALQYMNEAKVLHNNIEGSNILVQESGLVKLVGFGLAIDVSGDEELFVAKGSVVDIKHHLNPPEFQQAHPSLPITTKVDIWQLGVLIFKLVTGRTHTSPVPKRPSHRGQLRAVLEGCSVFSDDAFLALSGELQDLITAALTFDPKRRPSATDLLAQRWLTDAPGYRHGIHVQYREKCSPGEPGKLDTEQVKAVAQRLTMMPEVVQNIVIRNPTSLIGLMYSVKEKGQVLKSFESLRKQPQHGQQCAANNPDWNEVLVEYCTEIFADDAQFCQGKAAAAAAPAAGVVPAFRRQKVVVSNTELWRPATAPSPDEKAIRQMEREAAAVLGGKKAQTAVAGKKAQTAAGGKKAQTAAGGKNANGKQTASRKPAYKRLVQRPESFVLKERINDQDRVTHQQDTHAQHIHVKPHQQKEHCKENIDPIAQSFL
eukprot:scpid68441/ scgid0040/ Probable serine/threonine-protein kinase mkcD; MAP kinase cascade D